ncbi:ATP-binding protein [uncultured Maricaulis sp.]|uniref:AlbA family DNA-binding domain-containing protein n=1 Tax=uncultured Maricaulis sp. TaxID=174710 RepID=UPI0030DA07A0|tara:strand:+ start:24489 stop:25316 length:828 start_codon:yes stop_codon:yes gene_type:complete
MLGKLFHKLHLGSPYDPGRQGVLYAVVGSVVGVIILHPINMLVVWLEFRDLLLANHDGIGSFAESRLSQVPGPNFLAMNGIFAVLGGVIGVAFSILTNALAVQVHRNEGLLEDLQSALPSVVQGGENEVTEFKSSLRWDIQEARVNKSLEAVIAKTVAGLMNHRGGRLLIGVGDDGTITGLEADFETIRHKNPDGFERAFISVLQTHLGAVAATHVRCRFPVIEEKIICWVLVDKSPEPIFMSVSNTSKYYVRAGNSTRELNAAEAHDHIKRRGV